MIDIVAERQHGPYIWRTGIIHRNIPGVMRIIPRGVTHNKFFQKFSSPS